MSREKKTIYKGVEVVVCLIVISTHVYNGIAGDQAHRYYLANQITSVEVVLERNLRKESPREDT